MVRPTLPPAGVFDAPRGTSPVYLASPMDRAADWAADVESQRETARLLLLEHEFAVFDPSRAWMCNGLAYPHPALQESNREVIRRCDALFAILPEGVPTVGVPMEIELARELGIPVAVWTSLDSSFALCTDGVRLGDDPAELVFDLAGAIDSQYGAAWVEQQYGSRILFQRLEPNAELPTKAYVGDAGYDLPVYESTVVGPHEYANIPTGLAMALPDGYFGRITGRSSTSWTLGLQTMEGIIDCGFRGQLFARVYNPGEKGVVVSRGSRVAQLLVHRVHTLPVEEADVLPESERGENGFGSSGR